MDSRYAKDFPAEARPPPPRTPQHAYPTAAEGQAHQYDAGAGASGGDSEAGWDEGGACEPGGRAPSPALHKSLYVTRAQPISIQPSPASSHSTRCICVHSKYYIYIWSPSGILFAENESFTFFIPQGMVTQSFGC